MNRADVRAMVEILAFYPARLGLSAEQWQFNDFFKQAIANNLKAHILNYVKAV